MKKIIITLTALALGVSAFAKTEAELVSEYTALAPTASATLFQVQRQYADDNAADLIVAFNTWKTTPNAKLSYDELNVNITDKVALNTALTLKHVFAKLYDHNSATLEASDLVLCELGSGHIKDAKPAAWYEAIKVANWVVEGKTLGGKERFFLAHQFGDTAYIDGLSFENAKAVGIYWLNEWIGRRASVLLSMSDVEAAKSECSAIENYLINKKAFDSPELKQIQAVSKVLTARLVDSKILGK